MQQGAARWFFSLAVLYALIGMALGLQMAISQDHGQVVTHAHIMLAGWASLAIFAIFYGQFPEVNVSTIAKVHFWLQAPASIVMVGSLFLLYGGNPGAEAGAAVGSIAYLLGVLLFAWISLRRLWSR